MALELSLPDKSTQDPEDDFELQEKLGEGSFGVVWKAQHYTSKSVVAIKVVEADDAEDVLKEIQILKAAVCPKIVRYFGSYIKERDNEFYIVMEYCGGGSVSDLMAVCNRGLTEDQIALIVRDTLDALQHLHSKSMIHRDLKAGNILLTNKGEGKLADFGVSGQLSGTLAKRKTMVGSPFWMAPEVIMEAGHNMSADIWSLGITIIEMAERHPPLYNTHPMRAIFMIPSRPAPSFTTPSKYSKELNDFLARCLTKKPEERATVEELLKHDFIKKAKAVNSKCLVEMINEATTKISQLGSRAKAVGFEPAIDEAAANGRKTISKKAGATLRRTIGKARTNKKDLTQLFKNNDGDSGTMMVKDTGTMMVKDSPTGTMVSRDSPKGSPSGTMLVKDGSLTASGTVLLHSASTSSSMRTAGVGQSMAPSPPNPDFVKFSDQELQKLVNELQQKMENEVKEIEERYRNLRKPFLAALNERKAATPSSPASPQKTPSTRAVSAKK